MGCANPQSIDYSPAYEPWPVHSRRGRRPALIPANCSLTPSEAEELVRTRIQQPLIPPPDAILEHIQPISLPQQETNGIYRTQSAPVEAPPQYQSMFSNDYDMRLSNLPIPNTHPELAIHKLSHSLLDLCIKFLHSAKRRPRPQVVCICG